MKKRPLHRLTITIPGALMERLARMRANYRMSMSVIVEHIVADYLEAKQESHVVELLQRRGATLRRKSGADERPELAD